ncbi:hypothetical protein, partial [Granulicella sp. L60]|uniref:hypothetical protein n=1 Tax=Granulicella sp. L60 TaxID=1641866 RepID=UPI001C204CA3
EERDCRGDDGRAGCLVLTAEFYCERSQSLCCTDEMLQVEIEPLDTDEEEAGIEAAGLRQGAACSTPQ